MKRKRYWKGFATGAAIGTGATIAALLLGRTSRGSRVIRLQKSLQIGRPVEEVFTAWSDLDQLAQSSTLIHSVTTAGNRSHWVVEANGKQISWDAEIEQYIPNQAIGWKSLNGPKHTGRVSFSPLGNDTLISITMNYLPPLAVLRLSQLRERIQQYFEHTLREFKAALERTPETARTGTTGTHFHTTPESTRATGTLGTRREGPPGTQHTRFGGTKNPAEYTRPPEAKT